MKYVFRGFWKFWAKIVKFGKMTKIPLNL